MSFTAIPTLAGQAAIADAIANGTNLTLSRIRIGDGAGQPVTPLETQTQLVNERASVPVQSATRTGTEVKITGIVDEDTGGWTIRELGVEDAAGTLLFVADCPATEKKTLADGVLDILTLGLIVVVSETANVTLSVDGLTWATQAYVADSIAADRVTVERFLRHPFIAVDSVTAAIAPGSPAVGALYAVPAGATGLWSGQSGKLAQWNGTAWKFAPLSSGLTVRALDTGRYLRWTGSAWRDLFADIDEHLAGASGDLFTHPAGVAAMIGAAIAAASISRGKLLYFGQ